MHFPHPPIKLSQHSVKIADDLIIRLSAKLLILKEDLVMARQFSRNIVVLGEYDGNIEIYLDNSVIIAPLCICGAPERSVCTDCGISLCYNCTVVIGTLDFCEFCSVESSEVITLSV
jgi:hypothetical protein